ncbi:Hydroxypyruvate isomerase [Chlamydia abortus]|uniref:sugar phosphate isomerase/epimerase family protein n=1 Tax=Paenibacillus sp. 32O-W TaxID=1695218 RepID=UPI000A27BCF5|nr:sugar phosphate isomerase/epimerase [Paenibacillus sp. 32O-W]SHE09697.1 Hydroxypyruvate isomerase [Chlamydia abortus]
MGRMGIGLQMYTLRDETARDFPGTLRKVAALGYEGVEFAGYGGMTPPQLKNLLEELQLRAIGSHVSVSDLKDRLEEVVEMNAAIGASYVVCPYLTVEQRSEGALADTVSLFQKASRELAKHGIRFGYHNHDFELTETVGGERLFDRLFGMMSNEECFVEMDVCWVHHGGQDPLEYIRKYAGRVPLIHLKDMRTLEDGKAQTVELGQGEIDLPAVISAAGSAGAEWLIVEQDHCQNPPLESIETSMRWLKTNYL